VRLSHSEALWRPLSAGEVLPIVLFEPLILTAAELDLRDRRVVRDAVSYVLIKGTIERPASATTA